MIRVVLPAHLKTLARIDGEVELDLAPPATIAAVLTALEQRHPALRGTLRDHAGRERRPLVRFFAGGRDLSHDPLDTPLPTPVADGTEPLLVVGAMAGG